MRSILKFACEMGILPTDAHDLSKPIRRNTRRAKGRLLNAGQLAQLGNWLKAPPIRWLHVAIAIRTHLAHWRPVGRNRVADLGRSRFRQAEPPRHQNRQAQCQSVPSCNWNTGPVQARRKVRIRISPPGRFNKADRINWHGGARDPSVGRATRRNSPAGSSPHVCQPRGHKRWIVEHGGKPPWSQEAEDDGNLSPLRSRYLRICSWSHWYLNLRLAWLLISPECAYKQHQNSRKKHKVFALKKITI